MVLGSSLFGEEVVEVIIPLEAHNLNVGSKSTFKLDNKIVKYQVLSKNNTEVCVKSLTKDVEFMNQCRAIFKNSLIKEVELRLENENFREELQILINKYPDMDIR